MKDGVIADYRITEQMLNYFIKKVHGAKLFTPGPRIVICVPTHPPWLTVAPFVNQP